MTSCVKPLQILVFRGQNEQNLWYSVINIFFSCTLDSNNFYFLLHYSQNLELFLTGGTLCFRIFSQAVTDLTGLEVQVYSESNSVFWLGSYLKLRISVQMCSRPCSLCASIELICFCFLLY